MKNLLSNSIAFKAAIGFTLSVFLICGPLKTLAQSPEQQIPSKLYYTVELYTVPGVNLNQTSGAFQFGYGLHTQVTKGINEKAKIGLGLGIESFDESNFLPIYASIIVAFNNKKASPFLNARAGYSIAWNEDFNDVDGFEFEGGMMTMFNLGYKLPVTSEVDFYMLGGMRYQLSSLEVNDISERKTVFVGFNVIAGITF